MNAISQDYICLRCADQGRTCCSPGIFPEMVYFPVSETEASRLPEGAEKFLRREANAPNFIQTMNRLFPRQSQRTLELFPPQGEHLTVALDAAGVCAFLDKNGCWLPVQDRPWYCRLFPFWVINRQIHCFQDQACLAIKENSSLTPLFRLFGVTRNEILEFHTRLSRDWGFA
ncbi:MAG: zinc/iron-chelating domain-containing protein [Desulfovibrionaceae bacterium]|nr:zinc/iron-chelating domain-containing protein [Desulfovibrionaceae bacterium]